MWWTITRVGDNASVNHIWRAQIKQSELKVFSVKGAKDQIPCSDTMSTLQFLVFFYPIFT